MIPQDLVQTLNDICACYLNCQAALKKVKSFQALLAGSEKLRAEAKELQEIARSPRMRQPFSPAFACAFIGSTGHGKTSILSEMFPELARRHWLQTDVTDTTAQALVIKYAPAGSARLAEAVVATWNSEQLARLARTAEEENRRAGIRVACESNGVTVDGTEANFYEGDARNFRFDRVQHLRPLPRPYHLSAEERTDPDFIRHLTVKEEYDKVPVGPVLRVDSEAFDVMQLRAAVKEVELYDSFAQIAAWSRRPVSELAHLVFIDTPGLAAVPSTKDEVLRNILGKKNQQIVIELLRHDELDLIVHLVMCGQSSDFGSLWRAVEQQCSPEELADLGERLILAVNGTNKYFINEALTRKWMDAAVAQREGDHFANTIKDNILKKMSERGEIRPARVVFLDCRRALESEHRGRAYAEVYAEWRPVLEKWAMPKCVGYSTLNQYGLVDSFKLNIAALCDPNDRGQGFLVRHILGLILEKGPKLFIRKNLKRNRLHASIKRQRTLLLRCYDSQGRLNRQTIQAAIRKCLNFLDANDLTGPKSIEGFAAKHLDPIIDGMVRVQGPDVDPQKWVSQTFLEMCRIIYQAVKTETASPEHQKIFKEYAQEKMEAWRRQWGYKSAQIPLQSPQQPYTGDLVKHALRFHAREMLFQLLTGDTGDNTTNIMQDTQDEEQVRQTLTVLSQIEQRADALCNQYGVPVE